MTGLMVELPGSLSTATPEPSGTPLTGGGPAG